MRITLLVNYDPAAALALEILAPQLRQHTISVFYTRRETSDKTPPALRELARFEQHLFRGKSNIFERLKAQEMNAINTADFSQFERSCPDLVISIRHMSILRKPVIEVPKFGVINLHSGLLPQYQGVMATFWAMRDRQPTIGTTLHRIEDNSIDTGAAIAQSRIATDYEQSYLHNTFRLYPRGCRLIVEAVQSLAHSGSIVAHPQTGNPRYFSFPDDRTLADVPFDLFNEKDDFALFLDEAL